MRIVLLALLVPLHLALGTSARATTADDVCSPASTPTTCIVAISKNGTPVTSGSTLDFGTRTLVVPAAAALVVTDPGGSMTINAGAVTVQGGGALLALGGDISINTSGDVMVGLSQNGRAVGLIDVSAASGGGSIDIEATGNVEVDGNLAASAKSADNDGGFITITGATVTVPGDIDVSGQGAGVPGGLTIDATTGNAVLTPACSIQGTGGDPSLGGGDVSTVEIDADNGSVLANASMIDVSAQQVGGSGGSLSITAAGRVTFGGKLLAGGNSNPPDNTGDGGELDLEADGGSVSMTTSKIDLSAGPGGLGGSANVLATVDIALASIDVSATSNGSGGDITAETWCSLTLPAGSTLDARGPSGTNTLSSGGSMTIAGSLLADVNGNDLEYLTTPPVVTGTVDPPTTPIQNATLTPCGGPPPPPPPLTCGNHNLDSNEACDGDLGTCPAGETCTSRCTCEGCGDGKVQAGEQCDDGNTNDCDACKNDCTFNTNVCGDGVVDAACGEQCDDGNTAACDSCSPTCRTESCGNGIVECSEGCDDGPSNGTPGDSCTTHCTLAPGLPCACGNGVVEPQCGEQCDDHNTRSCDGCSPTCQIEASDPSGACVPCATDVDCDPLRACGTSTCVDGSCKAQTPPDCVDADKCTNDSCNPVTGACVHSPVVCPDACDGTQSCDPASGQCVSGPPPDCDDHDACTVDSCRETSPGFACVHALGAGLAGAQCRLAALESVINSATDIKTGTRKKLRSLANKLGKKLPVAAGSGKKAARALKQVNKGLQALTRTVSKASGKMGASTVTQLTNAIHNTMAAVSGL